MAKRTVPPNVNGKRKHGQPIGSVRKKAKYLPAAYQSAIESRIGFSLVFSLFY